jgi:predicted dithiol-disulfide oxidoreductase (DUF899 family)
MRHARLTAGKAGRFTYSTAARIQNVSHFTAIRFSSCYARGPGKMNTAYHYLDLVPKGRGEAGLEFAQAWVRYHDSCEN